MLIYWDFVLQHCYLQVFSNDNFATLKRRLTDFVIQKIRTGDLSELTEDLIYHYFMNTYPQTLFGAGDLQAMRDFIVNCEDYVHQLDGDRRMVVGLFLHIVREWRELIVLAHPQEVLMAPPPQEASNEWRRVCVGAEHFNIRHFKWFYRVLIDW